MLTVGHQSKEPTATALRIHVMGDYAYVVNVDGVVVRDGNYLLIERGTDEDHASGLLGFPGGKVEQSPGGEDTIEKTVTRELAEEVDVEVGDVEYVLSTTFATDDGTQCINIITLCEQTNDGAYPRAADEVAAVHWFSYAEIKEHENLPSFTERYVEEVEEFRASN